MGAQFARSLWFLKGGATILLIVPAAYGGAIQCALAGLIHMRNGVFTSAPSSENQQQQQQQGGLAAVLISAVIKQVVVSTFDDGHRYAGIATARLLATGVSNNALLYDPRSPNYRKD